MQGVICNASCFLGHQFPTDLDEHTMYIFWACSRKESYSILLDLACSGFDILPRSICQDLTSARPDKFLLRHVYIPRNLNL